MPPETEDYVLALNAGSSSLKFELFASGPIWRSCLRGAVTDIGRPRSALTIAGQEPVDGPVADHSDAARRVFAAVFDNGGGDVAIERLRAIGHRVVHGGARFTGPTLITDSVVAALDEIAELAPLHIPPALAVIGVERERFAGVPMVAVFDTTFFRRIPEHARRYAVPRSWYVDHAVQRFGFHGIAHEYISERVGADSRTGASRRRVVSLHLGQGCSATALLEGRPVETSMGFTPLEGLIMGTRPGDLDPGALVHLARRGFSPDALEAALNRESGLRGLSGTSDDVRELLEREASGDADAALALAAFCHRIRKYVGAYAAVLGGIDALAFGGGIGENAAPIRARICAGLEWLGLELDEEANARCCGTEGRISQPTSRVLIEVIAVREEEAIARAALETLGNLSPGAARNTI